MPTPVFVGRVDDALRLTLEAPSAYQSWLRGLAGHEVEVVVRARQKRRTNPQNRWLWGVALRLLGEHLGYDEHEREELHYALLEKCFGRHWDERLQAAVLTVRSSRLSTRDFAAYMEWLVRYAASEFDVLIPLPGEAEEMR